MKIKVIDEELFIIENGKQRKIISATKELLKELDKEKDDWNLAEDSLCQDKNFIWTKSVKTFIQKVKEDIEKQQSWTVKMDDKIFEILDKRAGDL